MTRRAERWPAVSTISSMRCAISTPPPSSIAGSASPSARATAIPGARTTTSSSCQVSSSSCSTVAEPDKLGSDGFSALFGTLQPVVSGAAGGLVAADPGKPRCRRRTPPSSAPPGFGVADAMHFEREGKRPDGSTVKVGFSLAFARDAGAPEIGFATCQQHFPENFWNPAFQQHRQHRERHRRRRAGRREPERPSHLPLRLQRRARSACHLERRHRIDAARRHQGDGPGRLPQPFRHRAAGHFLGCPARRPAISRARPRRADRGARRGRDRVIRRAWARPSSRPSTAMGATLVFE